MIYRMPIYCLRLAFSLNQLAWVFGEDGLLETVPLLAPELYFVELLDFDDAPWETVATAAVHESGAWTLNFADGREFSGCVGVHPYIV